MLPPCSHCGSPETYINAQARGPASHFFDRLGNFIETGYDRLWFDASHVVRCAGCHKIRRDLQVEEFKIVTKPKGS